MLSARLLLIIWVLQFLHNIQLGTAQWYNQGAATDYVFMNGKYYRRCANGYLNEQNVCVAFGQPSCPTCYQQQPSKQICPFGYELLNNWCYPLKQGCPYSTPTTPGTPCSIPTVIIPSPVPTTSTSTTTSTTTTTTTTPPPTTTTAPIIPPEALTRCPTGSVLVDNQCRKIICTKGEYHQGLCLHTACPERTVWYNGKCQPPAIVKTIIYIENRVHNTQQITQPLIHTTNAHNVTFEEPTLQTNITTITPRPRPRPPQTTRKPAIKTTTTERYVSSGPAENCCTIVTPRLCKQYNTKWVCFHRRYKRCNPNVCTSEVVYLKAPEILYDAPVLVMPPNPPLRACEQEYCDEGDSVDCSGCANSDREHCSTYCYRYMCPNGHCSYMDLREYCSIYPGEFGCSKNDGCNWHWCA